jgi:Domain of unknown function (DUF1833)
MATQNDALLEAYASCPPSARIFYTLEIWQASFAQAARVVANVGSDMQFGIEPAARATRARWWRSSLARSRQIIPNSGKGQPPSTKIKVDNVNRELVPMIHAALGVRQYIQVLYRGYLSTDLTEPAYGPIEFELRNVQMVGASLTGAAMVRNLQNKRFPRLDKNYDYIQFPSLLPSWRGNARRIAPAAAAWWHCLGRPPRHGFPRGAEESLESTQDVATCS